ncbi:NAD/NADP-dependent octopine/nopaline dehydrogenase family protein [Riemerella columbina]|uniref:NAD/NADP-dependent octopine/nopaline dehydrogenase family protein n=1 Tax=Riemerella columbina TaxID=103810 RepID=UPI000374AB40|nr:NAD/NADP-dependent octopine/nopaline dehydrogenase family protein [Riemerella columbina]
MKNKITIIGGGNSTHSLIPLLSKNNNEINLFTRKPDQWQETIEMEYTLPDGSVNDILKGTIKKVSADPKDVIPEADCIILSIPVYQYRNLLHQIAPYISKDKKVYVGTIYGQGGFNWMVKEIIDKFNLKNVVYFASGLIPWITRTKEYGKVGINYGCKKNNVVAVYPKEEFENLKSLLLDDLCYNYFGKGEYLLADNFLSLTLSVDNQIIHQTRLYGLYLSSGGQWDAYDEVPFFYRDYDDLSAKVLEDLDNEYSLIREKIIESFPNHDFKYMMNYLDLEHFSYGSSSPNIKESFTESQTLGQIPTPVVQNNDGKWVFDATHRFFYDDIYYGIVIAKWMAEKLEIKTPTIDKILKWAGNVIDDTIIDSNEKINIRNNEKFLYGTPDVYGYTSIKELIS